ncbi:DUF1775 domain-containing protein [Streptomyces sp. NPDC008313]|uniref:DUF1775 domain-containing protein n=1 Tax=Streptomyces sp. NPDC008313 TaxID=3364826 RepID=UPI0036EECF79
MSRRTRRHIAPFVTAAGTAGAVLLLAGPAAAHVRVIGDVIPGKPATLQFRVPSELADATTVRVVVAVPSDISVTSVPALDGWTEKTVTGSAGKSSQVAWTAEPGHEIEPAASQTFTVKVGPVPDRYSLTFDTEQTYSNGTIAAWNQEQTGKKEPEFPAPVLVINPEASPAPGEAADSPKSGTGESAAPPSVAAKPADTAADEDEGSSMGLPLAIGAGIAAIGAAAAVWAARRRRGGGASAS